MPRPHPKTALLLALCSAAPLGSACELGLQIQRGDFACGAGGPCPTGMDAASAPDAGFSAPDANAPDSGAPGSDGGTATDAFFFDAMNLDAAAPDATARV